MGKQPAAAMSLVFLTFDGSYEAMPSFDPAAPIRFFMRPDSRRHPAELPLSLTVGGHYPDKLYFSDKTDGKRHWIQINRVCLCDMRREGKPPDWPKKELEKWCPKGMSFPVIEYESEEDLSLEFYSRAWLDAEPAAPNDSCAVFLFYSKPEQPAGKLGFRLKTALIREPVPADTSSLEAELFAYYQDVPTDDIIIE